MNLLDLYEGREPYQQAIDRLEQRRIEDLEARMDDYARRGMKNEFQKCKAERDSYHKVKMDEGSMKQWLWNEAERLDRDRFIANAGEYGMSDEEAAEWWDSINGVDEASIGQDIVNKSEKMARATPPTTAGKVASTVKNAAKWLAGKGGPGREGPTYEGAEDIADRGEYDQEGDMAKDNIHTIVRNARELESVISDNDNLPEWVQDKLANIKGMMTAVSEYMQTQHERDHEEGVAIAEKLKGLPSKKLGSARDAGKSVRKFRAQRGLEEAGTDSQWSKESDWKAIPKAKSGKPADPRGEVTHLSDVARREAERKANQKKNSEEVDEGWSDKANPVPYGVYINGRQWKEFATDDHARAVADKLSAKLKAEGSDKKVTIAPSESYMKKLGEDDPMSGATVDIDQMAGADADTNPGNLGEAGSPAQQAAIAISMKKAHKKPKTDEAHRDPWKEKHFGPGKVVQKVFKVKADNGKSYNIKAATEQQAKETFQKHAPDANILSIKFVSNIMDDKVAEAQTDVKSGMAKIYHKLAPKIERYKDSFLAGQLYDELENYAELHGVENEFKRMIAGARNRAHMDYDTNPGGFQNWFWYLPFGDTIDENLRDWFGKEKWVRMDTKGNIKGDCARGSESEGKPKCLPQAKAHALGKKGRASAAQKKRREDPNPERKGKAINVATRVKEDDLDEACWKGYHKDGNKELFGKTVPNCVKNEAVAESHQSCPECGGAMYPDTMINEKQDACYHKVKSRYKVWPSAYASGALVQCRKKGAANWGNKSESVDESYTGVMQSQGITDAKLLEVARRIDLFAKELK